MPTVSIHAPAQGATSLFYLLYFNWFFLLSARTISSIVITDILFSKNIIIKHEILGSYIFREHPWFLMSSLGSRFIKQ